MSDLFEVLGVIDDELDTHLHFEFVQVHVEASNFGVLNSQRHLLRDSGHLQSVTLDQFTFQRALTVALLDLDGLKGVFVFTGGTDLSNPVHGVNDQFTEQTAFTIYISEKCLKFLCLRSNDLGRHGGLGSIDEGFSADNIDFNSQVFLKQFKFCLPKMPYLNVLASFSDGDFITSDNVGGVELVLDHVIGSLNKNI